MGCTISHSRNSLGGWRDCPVALRDGIRCPNCITNWRMAQRGMDRVLRLPKCKQGWLVCPRCYDGYCKDHTPQCIEIAFIVPALNLNCY